MFAWIGMKYNGKEHKWMDGMDTQFDNWSDMAVKVGTKACARMSLNSGMIGKWRMAMMPKRIGKWLVSSCNNEALVVCQRTPELSLNSMKDIIQEMSEIIEMQQAHIDERFSNVKKKIDNQQGQINSLERIFYEALSKTQNYGQKHMKN